MGVQTMDRLTRNAIAENETGVNKTMKIRITAKIRTDPCIYRDVCQGACDWCKTHSYTDACVGMAMLQAESLRKNWVAAEEERKRLQAEKESSKLYSLEEIAQRICHSYDDKGCEECPATDYCSKGHTGTIYWLRKVLQHE